MKSHASMNRIFRLVWSAANDCWVAVAENASGAGKSSGAAKKRTLALVALLALSAGLQNAQAGPNGGVIVSGQASIAQSGGSTTITQGSQNASINWQGFSVGAAESVTFKQPSATAIAVNRVIGPDASQILGRINANGQVWLVNPNGVIFGKGSQVNVGGLVASTLDLQGQPGASATFSGASKAAVINQGSLTAADSGYIALLGHQAINQGIISARLGSVALGAGSSVTLEFSGSSLVKIQVLQSALDALAKNEQLITTPGGQVLMSAGARDSLLASAVNNTGLIEAQGMEMREGKIVLLSGMKAGQTTVSGKLDASAPNSGNGGFIETSGAQVKILDGTQITTRAPQGKNGLWLIDPTDFNISKHDGDISGATLSASLEGGDVQVQTFAGPVPTKDGDLNVNDTVAWAAPTRLTLDAAQSININAPITATSGQLTLNYGLANFANPAPYAINVNAPVSLPAGQNLTVKGGSQGAPSVFTVITDIGSAGSMTGADLQGINGALGGRYALGADLDLAPTQGWAGGFTPIGDGSSFAGQFWGMGHTISNLTLQTPVLRMGLFGTLSGSSLTRDLTLKDPSINFPSSDYIGALSGESQQGAEISRVSVQNGAITGLDHVGGLVGRSEGVIRSSKFDGSAFGASFVGGIAGFASGDIFDTQSSGIVNGSYNVGGIVGSANSAGSQRIERVSSSASVSGILLVGGIAGQNAATIDGASSSGSITGDTQVGGIVGRNFSDINNSSSSAAITDLGQGGESVGGIVGENYGSVDNAHYSGQLTASSSFYVGGVVGTNVGGNIVRSSSEEAALIQAASTVGGVVGQNAGGYVTNSWSSARIEGYTQVGGVIGFAHSGSYLSGLYFNGSLSGDGQVGGLVGFLADSVLINSYAVGSIQATGYIGGGLVGEMSASQMDNVYFAGIFPQGGAGYGSLVGLVGDSQITNAWVDTGRASTSYIGTDLGTNSISVTLANSFEMTNPSAMAGYGMDLANIWYMPQNMFARPTLRSEQSAEIINAHQLHAIGVEPAASYTLGRDINLQAGAYPDIWEGVSFSPIAYGEVFIGALDGKGHTLSNMNFTQPSMTASGLFYIIGGSIQNLTLDNFNINARENTGALAGELINGATVSNVGVINSQITGLNAVGGLVGYMDNGAIIEKSYAMSTSVTTPLWVGGLVGYNAGGAISESFASGGYLHSSNDFNGGLVGYNGPSGTITDSYSAMGQTATGSPTFFGGLVGRNDGAITRSYSNSFVSTPTSAIFKGLVGAGPGLVLDSFYNQDNAPAPTIFGTPLTSAQLSDKSIYAAAGWDMASTWIGYDAQYAAAPLLRAFMTPLFITAQSLTQAYDGAQFNPSLLSFDASLTLGGLTLPTAANGGPFNPTAIYSGALYARNAGVYALDLGIPGGDPFGYAITLNSATLTISPLAIGSSGSLAASKSYDGTTAATVTGTALDAVISGDVVALQINPTFSQKDVGSNLHIELGGALSGTDAGNYTFVQPSNLSADITPKALTVTGTTASNKVYDATTGATLSGGSLVGVVGLESVSLSQSGYFASKSVNPAGAIIVTDSLSGADAGNYALTQPTGVTAAITPFALSISGLSASDKVYDGTLAATLSGGSVSALGGDVLTLSQTGVFVSKDVGANIGITFTGSLGGADAGNYTLTQPTGLGASITPRALTVTGSVASGKVYDGSLTASIGGGALSNFIIGDAIGLTESGVFLTKDVGTNIAITATDALTGADAGNYSLTQPTGLFADITPKALTVIGSSAAGKVYDASASAMISGGSLVGLIGLDAVSLSEFASFADANAGVGKSVIANSALSGPDAGNYSLIQPTGLIATISPAQLTYTAAPASAVAGAALPTFSGSVSGWLGADTLLNATSGSLTWLSSATDASAAGSYEINGGGLLAQNYLFAQASGNATALTLSPAPVAPPAGPPVAPPPPPVPGFTLSAQQAFELAAAQAIAQQPELGIPRASESSAVNFGLGAFANAPAANFTSALTQAPNAAPGLAEAQARQETREQTLAREARERRGSPVRVLNGGIKLPANAIEASAPNARP